MTAPITSPGAAPSASPNATDVKPFVGAEDFEVSRDFYVAMGWQLNFDTGGLAELELGNCRFYLQNYFQQDWCHNSMLHVTVDDAQAWFEHTEAVLSARTYGEARVRPPARQDYGALVTFVWDPSGVLLHFAQPLEASATDS